MAGVTGRGRHPSRATKTSEPVEDEERRIAWENVPTAYLPESFNPTGEPHPNDPTLLRFTEFEGFVKTFRVDPLTGEIILTVGVPANQKHAAFALTDHMLHKYRFDVYKAPRAPRRRRITETEQPEE